MRTVVFGIWLLSIAFVIYLAGILSQRYQILPARMVDTALVTFQQLRKAGEIPWYFQKVSDSDRPAFRNTPAAQPGLNLITMISTGERLTVKIVDMDGKELHAWDLDWFKVWPQPTHLKDIRPTKDKLSAHIHGAVLMQNGDLVFNYDHFGLVRIGRDGKVVWRLPYQTHHSVHLHDDGNLWVCGQRERTSVPPDMPHRTVPYDENTLIEVSPSGEILNEWVVADIFRKNGLDGFYFMGSDRFHPAVRNDILHLNDVEPFPATMKEGFFKRNDVMISLRNVNLVLVFDRTSLAVKFLTAGKVIAQHDPDFIDGDHISIYDNNHREASPGVETKLSSRIVVVDATNDTQTTYYEGTPDSPFFSTIMGKHQWLGNGNLLITDSMNGRGFEVSPSGNIVWEFRNYVADDLVGIVEEVQRIPLSYAELYGGTSDEP